VFAQIRLGEHPHVSILVFLDQALKENTTHLVDLKKTSFNPCFPGSSAERALPDFERTALAGFNPCFPGSSAERKQVRCHRPRIASFNPCFPGSSAESDMKQSLGFMYLFVSILVFLDQALKELKAALIFRMMKFQSLFSWIKR